MRNQWINKYSTGQLHRHGMEIRGKIKTADDGSEFLHIYQRKVNPGFLTKLRYAVEDAFGRSKPLTEFLGENTRVFSPLLTHVKQFVRSDKSESAGQIGKIDLPFSKDWGYIKTAPIKLLPDEMNARGIIGNDTNTYTEAHFSSVLKKIEILRKEKRHPYLKNEEKNIFDKCLDSLEKNATQLSESSDSAIKNQALIEIKLIQALKHEVNYWNLGSPEPDDLKSELSHHIKDKHPFDLITRHQLNAANGLLHHLLTTEPSQPLTNEERSALKKLDDFVNTNKATIPENIFHTASVKIQARLKSDNPETNDGVVLFTVESPLNPDIPDDYSIPETAGTRTMRLQNPNEAVKNGSDTGTDFKTSETQTPETKVEISKQDHSPTSQNSADLSEFNKRFITMRVTSRIDQLIQPISELTTEQKGQVNHYLRNPEKIPRYIDPTLDLEARELLKAIGSRRRELNTFFDDAESAFANTVFDEKLRNILDDLELKQPAQSTHNQKPLSGS